MVFAAIQKAKALYFEWRAKRAGRERTRERAAEETESSPFFPAPRSRACHSRMTAHNILSMNSLFHAIR